MPINLMKNNISECFGEHNACIQNTMKICKVMCVRLCPKVVIEPTTPNVLRYETHKMKPNNLHSGSKLSYVRHFILYRPFIYY